MLLATIVPIVSLTLAHDREYTYREDESSCLFGERLEAGRCRDEKCGAEKAPRGGERDE